ncbi:hypothetical protein [Pseudomonas sp. MYb118]|uniref:hypothetical protein n=1 Tax=Pseudomonas sp. MYb118 TaxID=1848720 RepID=UPI0034CD0256
MRPKHPPRPKAPGPSIEGPAGTRELAPDYLPTRPGYLPGHDADPLAGHRLPEHTQIPGAQATAVAISDLPPETHVTRISLGYPISNYYLPPRLVERLPAADPQTGLRTLIAGRHYVDLADGGTVLLGADAQGQLRARQPSELVPSGPRIELVPGSHLWRQVLTPSLPWEHWGISRQQLSPQDIIIDGKYYRTLPRGNPADHPIAYIKNPDHPLYDFDLLQGILRHDADQQPRGAIRIPPTQHWQIDPTLPFERPLDEPVAGYFPWLSQASAQNVARQQFVLANGSDTATEAGITTLRQVFNDWKTGTPSPKPELADPLLMLPITPTIAGHGAARILELPHPANLGPLRRLTFDPSKFHREWDYFTSTQYAGDLKRFMRNLLISHGYTVFEPTSAQTYASLVFQRSGHDFVYHMTLHRAHGKRVHIQENARDGLNPLRLPELIGAPATQVLQAADAVDKVVWLKGGSHISLDHENSVFIMRTADPRQ